MNQMHCDSDGPQLAPRLDVEAELTTSPRQLRAAAMLHARFPGSVRLNAELGQLSQWKVGGKAICLFQPNSTEELAEGLMLLAELEAAVLTIGSTTNLLFSDHGLDAILVQMTPRISKLSISGPRVTCEAGAWVPVFALQVGRAGLTGVEHTVGIPGTLGGLIVMNGGSQRKGVGTHITTVHTLTRSGQRKTYDKQQCEFAYRTSVFQNLSEIIINAEFEFETRPYPAIRAEMREILRSRRLKFPRKLPNCGSVFVSDPSLYEKLGPPGSAIELCGLKGYRVGGAEISPRHANFIVNLGGAKARDILELVYRAYTAVLARSGCAMKAEAIYVDRSGALIPAHKKALQMFEGL